MKKLRKFMSSDKWDDILFISGMLTFWLYFGYTGIYIILAIVSNRTILIPTLDQLSIRLLYYLVDLFK